MSWVISMRSNTNVKELQLSSTRPSSTGGMTQNPHSGLGVKAQQLFLCMISHIFSCPVFSFPSLPNCLQGGSDAGHEGIQQCCASPCLSSSACPLGWSPSHLLPVTVVSCFFGELQSLWLFRGVSGASSLPDIAGPLTDNPQVMCERCLQHSLNSFLLPQ